MTPEDKSAIDWMFEAHKAGRDLADTAPKTVLKQQEEIPTEGEGLTVGPEGSPEAAEKLMEEIDQKQRLNEQLTDSVDGVRVIQEAISSNSDEKKARIEESIAKAYARLDQEREAMRQNGLILDTDTRGVLQGINMIKMLAIFNNVARYHEWRLKRHEAKARKQESLPTETVEASVAERSPETKEQLYSDIELKSKNNEELTNSMGGEEAITASFETFPDPKKQAILDSVSKYAEKIDKSENAAYKAQFDKWSGGYGNGLENAKQILFLRPMKAIHEWRLKRHEAKK